MYIEYIQSILLIISAIFIIIAAIGIVSLNRNGKNVDYARIHIVGVFDIAIILAMLAIGQWLLAGIYFILAPFTAHAIGYAFFKSEDSLNNPNIEKTDEEEDVEIESPFIHPKSKIQELEQSTVFVDDSDDMGLSVATLEITEGE
ncbi:MAG: cation:proton antiporter [Methanobrevibacter sp.]|uniref:cation:proton antiporter n=1 Tax=Methanobrevibacter sp. TaxID=66852 RepID=UPI0026E05F06|nr:cation:proton antiporter [Methanobrevibacter sp.]MDO5848069.1 cation:proton antiporter [Methanobrevibacter sp.]